ncbi:MAG: PAS domain-containing protein, partial [Desulfonatronovibrio sp.]
MKTLREKAEARLKNTMPEIDSLGPAEIKTLIHDYQVYQIELEIQNEELRSTQQQLSQARDQFVSLYNNAPAGYISIDHSAIIHQTNETFAAMVGKEPGQLIGRPLADLLSPEDRAVFHGRYRAFFKNPQGKRLELSLAGKHGNLVVRCVGKRENIPYVQTADADS